MPSVTQGLMMYANAYTINNTMGVTIKSRSSILKWSAQAIKFVTQHAIQVSRTAGKVKARSSTKHLHLKLLITTLISPLKPLKFAFRIFECRVFTPGFFPHHLKILFCFCFIPLFLTDLPQ